jgi:hypothetical protein
MKKTYLQPAMMVVTLQQHSIICTSKGVNCVSTNLDEGDAIRYGGGSSTQSARVKSNTVDWDDDWSE